jgi:hypothetical protein
MEISVIKQVKNVPYASEILWKYKTVVGSLNNIYSFQPFVYGIWTQFKTFRWNGYYIYLYRNVFSEPLHS